MSLPGIPRFEDLVKSFGMDFWIRTDCKPADDRKIIVNILEGQREDLGQLFHVGLNWYNEMEEAFHIFCRDSTNRVLEAMVPVPSSTFFTEKDFHHVMIRIYSMDEGQIECLIDGKSVTVQLVQNEHPIAFNPWPHRLFIGSHLDDNNIPVKVFRGTIMQLRFWTLGEPLKPVIMWPLLVEDGKLSELTKNIPEDHHETLQNLQRIEEPAPSCAPFFDGNLVTNIGALSTWGELMQNWRVELRFRTDVTSRMMSLFGVTDQKYKMQEVGIVLNAEPVFSKERVHYHELNTTFYLVDAFGACCSALLRGTDRQNLMDGAWHTIVWRCIDSESNKFSVKIDGVFQDLLYVSRDGPRRFDAFENWMCVAGHNVRNWKVIQPFTGQMSRFYVSMRGYRYVTLHMNEGPGSYVMQDRSGHRNHGLLINPTTNVVRKMDTIWMPAQEEMEVEGDDGPKLDVVDFTNNNVTIACVVFTCGSDEKSVTREIIYDVYHQGNYELQVVDHHISDSRKEWKTWRCIPDACYKPLETVTQLEEAINYVIAAKVPRGHLMVVLRVGDCHVTFLHVQEPEFPEGATYNCNMLKWHYPYMVEGIHGKRELMLNRMIEGMEGVLMSDSLTPFTTARLGPLNATGQSIVSEDIIRSLQNSGRPWFLPAVLHHNLLNSACGSSLHIIHRIYTSMSYNEAAAVALFNKRLHDSAKEKAAIVIQRNWRSKLAKADAFQRQTERQIRDRKIEEIRTFRMNPVIQAKQRLYALLVTLHQPKTDQVPPIASNTQDMEDALVKQGYDVERLSDPSLQTLMKAVSQIDSDKSSFIFISGYGGVMNLQQPPLLPLQSLHVSLTEGNDRAGIILEEGRMFRAMVANFYASLQSMAPKKKKKKSAAPPRRKPEEIEAENKERETQLINAVRAIEQEQAFKYDTMTREWETDVQLISKTIRQTVMTTREYEAKYKTAKGQDSRYYVYPLECKRIDPYANQVVDVEDIIQTALHRQAPPIGLQSIVAIDLQPITPYSRGVACLASSTGNTLVVPYTPGQRCIAYSGLDQSAQWTPRASACNIQVRCSVGWYRDAA
ncbi:hypothetical protein STCU_09724 [Strigomonas culicis]|uniref:Uncharacterized protein n=1 Tax=Strigomonas culicis TaxID=28005 RepID=S9TQG0_9TRYP|nr:hypothetical protein STCU_09724 [Strigomonas culicis]|eukprot:EPY18884.1 hypothetical protein STCU_09724 [Strigomonas culicis]